MADRDPAPSAAEVLPSGRRVDSWWVTDLQDIADRMAQEAGCPLADAWECIRQIATARVEGHRHAI